MKRITLFLLISLFSGSIFAQITISEARSKAVGSTVTVTGIVTNGDELGTIRYIQDETAGIGIYDNKLSAVQRGDSITVTGVLDDYNNLLEINPVSTFNTDSRGNSLPEPKVLSIAEIGEQYEGQLIKIENVQITGNSGTFSGGKNYTFTDGTNSAELRIDSHSPIVGQPIPTDNFDLVAICSQWSFNNPQSGYQLLPRTMDDFISGSVISFTTPVEVGSLSQNSIMLEWQTDSGGNPFVRYGNSNNVDSLTNIKQGDSTTSDEYNQNMAEITGLQASQLIYAQAFMVVGNDTAFSSIGTYITQSNSSGAIHVYFNTPVDQSLAEETAAVNVGRYMEDTLAAYINRAEQTIDMALYNFDNNTVKNALNAAYDRGVKIRFITDGSTGHASVYDLNAGIPVLERPEVQQGGIMHNKFAAIDAENVDPDKAWVWSGSTNLTYSQLNTDANNMIFIQDQSLAKTYTIEFEEMWGSTGETANAQKAKFGEAKSDNTPHKFIIGGKWVESYFSPSDNTNQKLIDAMETADNDLYVETMLITRSDLASAILDAYDRGVKVHVVTNAESDNTSYVNEALSTGLPAGKFVFDDQQVGLLHHKLAIIDAFKSDSDPQLITGSHNWSNSANDINDENTLIIHNQDIANQYIQQFAYRFEHDGGNLVVSAPQIQIADAKVFPNPSTGILQVQSSAALKSIELYHINGMKIREWQISSANEFTVDLSSQQPGIYLLSVVDESGAYNVYKIVKQ
ncbi:MAG TPA: phospholipase D-like domain-containing protein [Draconibacterium sp.]|nr:phospholipase D-like domain-containing protein [Draconibacterium sp.]